MTTATTRISFPESLDQQAKALRATLDGRTYRDGEERTSAGQAVAVLDVDEHLAGLAWLIEERVQRFVLGDCRLDETADASYALIDRIAEQLLGGVQAEGGPLLDTLQAWATDYVVDYAGFLQDAA